MPLAADDPDLAHLFELLRMLPGPAENREFWTAVHPSGDASRLSYVYEKMSVIGQVAKDPSPQNVEYLARYLLYFFAGERPRLWKTLNTVFDNDLTMTADEPGRWWAEDTCRTAWALYIRYRQRPRYDGWARQWEFPDDHNEFSREWLGLPDRP